MPLKRSVLQHLETLDWSYVEHSDENPYYVVILGSKRFATKEQAEEYAKGFKPGSYVYVEPKASILARLQKDRDRVAQWLAELDYSIQLVEARL